MSFEQTRPDDPADVVWIARVLARHGRLTFRPGRYGRVVATWRRKSGSGRTRAAAVLDLAARVGLTELAGSGGE